MVDRPPPPLPPYRVNIDRMKEEWVELYRHVPLTGSTIPVEVTPLPMDDYIDAEEDILEAIKHL